MNPDYQKNPSARRIINSWIKKYEESPAEWKAQRLEDVIDNISVDYSDGDASCEARGEPIN